MSFEYVNVDSTVGTILTVCCPVLVDKSEMIVVVEVVDVRLRVSLEDDLVVDVIELTDVFVLLFDDVRF